MPCSVVDGSTDETSFSAAGNWSVNGDFHWANLVERDHDRNHVSENWTVNKELRHDLQIALVVSLG
jgi:hypothetical protein